MNHFLSPCSIRLLWARKSHRAESEYSEEYISEYDSMIRTGTPEFFMQESTPDSLTEKIPTFQKLRTMKQLFFHLVPVLAFGLVLAACDNDSDEWTQPYEFAWSYGAESQFSVWNPATVTDLSLGVETREWSFEDATPATSTDPEPSVVFNSKGIKTVTLTIHFLNGQVQSESFGSDQSLGTYTERLYSARYPRLVRPYRSRG